MLRVEYAQHSKHLPAIDRANYNLAVFAVINTHSCCIVQQVDVTVLQHSAVFTKHQVTGLAAVELLPTYTSHFSMMNCWPFIDLQQVDL